MTDASSTDPSTASDGLAPETGAAVRDLLAAVAGLEDQILTGDKALPDETALLEGYRWMFAILQVGVDAFVTADPSRPRFTEIVGPDQEVGRRQQRRVLPVRADRPVEDLPGAGHQGRRRVLLADRLRRTRRRPLLRAHRDQHQHDRPHDRRRRLLRVHPQPRASTTPRRG